MNYLILYLFILYLFIYELFNHLDSLLYLFRSLLLYFIIILFMIYVYACYLNYHLIFMLYLSILGALYHEGLILYHDLKMWFCLIFILAISHVCEYCQVNRLLLTCLHLSWARFDLQDRRLVDFNGIVTTIATCFVFCIILLTIITIIIIYLNVTIS